MISNDVFYVTSLIEYTARKTLNKRGVIVQCIGLEGLQHLLDFADVNHCLSFEQVSSEVIEDYQIPTGTFDTISNCEYKIPSHTAIGKVYARLVEDLETPPERWAETLTEIFSSETSDDLSDFRTSFFFAPRSEVLYYYKLEKNML